MVFVASKERSRLTQGSPPGDLCLRVVGTARDGQVVRLTAAKCAIGSAEGCTLRLRARGVRPVHCLVLRGTHGTVARSWAPNTQLNGEPFRDALLEAGDRLTIGPVEFEVLEAEGPPAGPTDAGRTVVLDRRPADRSLHATRTLVAKPKRSKRWRSHVRKLVVEVRKLRTEIDAFQATAQTVSPAVSPDTDEIREKLEGYKQQNEQWESTLQGLQAELDSRERQLADELAELESARQSQATQQQLAEREAELQSLVQQQGEAARQMEAFQSRGAELDERTRTLQQREAELEALAAAARQSSEELAAGRGAFEEEKLAAQGQLDEQRKTLEASEAAHRESLEARRIELEQSEASLMTELASMLADRQAREDELRSRAEELDRRAAELAEREAQLAAIATERPQHAFETSIVEPSEFAVSEATSQQAALEAAEAAARQAAEELIAAQAQLDAQRAEALTERERHEQELAALRNEIAEHQNAEQGNAAAEAAARQAEFELLEAAARQTAEELAAARAQLETQKAEALAERERHAQELAGANDEIAERKRAVAEAESQLRSEREALFNERLSQEADLRHATEELQRQRGELEERVAELETRAAEVATQAAVEPVAALTSSDGAVAPDSAQASELAEKEMRLAELQAEIEREREALLADREEFDHARARSSARLDADAEELKRDREALAAEQEELAAEREAFEAQQGLGSDRREAEETRQSFAPREDEEDDEESEEAAVYSEFSRSQPPQLRQASLDTVRAEAGDTARAKPQSDEDVSIADYMAALLNRTRGGQSVPVIQPADPPRRNKRKSDVQPVVEAERVDESEQGKDSAPQVPVLDMPATLVQLERRKQPEVRPDMNVLREIGITHARSAIATHGQQRSLNQAYGTLATSLVCFVAAFLVFYFGTHTVFHLTGMAIVVIGIYWLGTSIWAVNKVLTSMKQRRGGLRATLAEIDAEIEALRKEAEAELEEAK